MTAGGGNFIKSEFNRNERAPQCGVATIDEQLSKSMIWVTAAMRKLSALKTDLSVLQHWQQIVHAGVSALSLVTPSHSLVTADAGCGRFILHYEL